VRLGSSVTAALVRDGSHRNLLRDAVSGEDGSAAGRAGVGGRARVMVAKSSPGREQACAGDRDYPRTLAGASYSPRPTVGTPRPISLSPPIERIVARSEQRTLAGNRSRLGTSWRGRSRPCRGRHQNGQAVHLLHPSMQLPLPSRTRPQPYADSASSLDVLEPIRSKWAQLCNGLGRLPKEYPKRDQNPCSDEQAFCGLTA
jgi:hypothetical protein